MDPSNTLWWNLSANYSAKVNPKFRQLLRNITYFASLSASYNVKFYGECLVRLMDNQKLCYYVLMNINEDIHKYHRDEFNSVMKQLRISCMTDDYLCERHINILDQYLIKWSEKIIINYNKLQ
jgi:hypothetical protein